MSVEFKGLSFKIGENIVLLTPEEAFRLLSELALMFGKVINTEMIDLEDLLEDADMEIIN